jgi:hypothetical protein
MTRKFARALVRRAARRWPSEYLREWSAELDVLAAERKRVAMVRYATSLVRSRPAISSSEPVSRERSSLMTGKVRGTAVVVVLAPFVIAGLTVFSAIGSLIDRLVHVMFPAFRPGFPTEDIWVGLVAVIMAGFVAAAATWLGRHLALSGPFRTPVVLLIPVTALLLLGEFEAQRQYPTYGIIDASTHLPVVHTSLVGAILVWAFGLTLALIAAAYLRRQGRRVSAWIAGIAGAVVVLDLTVAVPNLRLGTGMGNLSLLTLLPGEFAGQSAGQWEGNFTLFMLMCSWYAVGYAIGAAGVSSASSARYSRAVANR